MKYFTGLDLSLKKTFVTIIDENGKIVKQGLVATNIEEIDKFLEKDRFKKKGDLTPYYWSYKQSKFIAGVVNWNNHNRPAIGCRPQKNFFQNIPQKADKKSPFSEFYLNKGFWKIDTSYRPFILTEYVSISVKAPNFEPSSKRRSSSMNISSRSFMNGSYEDYGKGQKIVKKIDNLSKVEGISPIGDFYYALDKNNKIATTVNCSSVRNKETACTHRFYKNNAIYRFEHSEKFLSQSSQMEEKLFDLFESFKN